LRRTGPASPFPEERQQLGLIIDPLPLGGSKARDRCAAGRRRSTLGFAAHHGADHIRATPAEALPQLRGTSPPEAVGRWG